ncbi:hypothetical protein NUSPORA_00565 [Nucleospora cyclopteri]
MFDLTDKDIKDIIINYNKKIIGAKEATVDEKIGPFPMSYVVECGLKYIYGEQHMVSGQIIDCKTGFMGCINSKTSHKCKNDFVNINLCKLKTKDTCILSKWTGNNLAVITSKYSLDAYYKNELLFEHGLNEISAVDATSSKIFLGTLKGALLHFDPISRSYNSQSRHSAGITAVHCFNNAVLTCSEDGTIFHKKNIKVTNGQVYEAVQTGENTFVCICSDNTVVKVKNEETTSFVGHKDRIEEISYKKVPITTSADGYMGILTNKLNMINFECSKHRQLLEDQVIGFGKSKLRRFDLNNELISDIYINDSTVLNKTSIEISDCSNNVVAFITESGSKNKLNLLDLRSNEIVEKELEKKVLDLKFSPSGDSIFIACENLCLMAELKYMH